MTVSINVLGRMVKITAEEDVLQEIGFLINEAELSYFKRHGEGGLEAVAGAYSDGIYSALSESGYFERLYKEEDERCIKG